MAISKQELELQKEIDSTKKQIADLQLKLLGRKGALRLLRASLRATKV